MRCEAIRPVIRQFLDDLLDEKDYQDIQRHLDGCTRCHEYASSVGTLSFRLHQLGQVPMPPDVASTVLFELKKQPKAAPAPPQVASSEKFPGSAPVGDAFTLRTRNFWIATVAVFGISLGVLVFVAALWNPGGKKTAPSPAVVPAPQISASEPEPSVAPPSAEWHYHLSKSSRSELDQLVQEFQLTLVSRQTERGALFDVPSAAAEEFRRRLEALSGVVKEYGEPEPASGDVRVSVYFE